MDATPEWIFSFVIWWFVGVAALIIAISAIPYLYRWLTERFYKQIAEERGWHYEKHPSEIPSSTTTRYGKAYSKHRSVFRRWIDTAGIHRIVGPAIFGDCNTRKFTVAHYAEKIHIHRAGTYATHYTLIGAPHKGIVGNVYISKEGILQKIGKALGMQDVELGDPIFDPMFRIKGSYMKIREVLDISARQKLLGIISQYGWKNFGVLEINQKEVVFTKDKVIKNKDFLLAIIDLVTTIANNVDKY